MNGFIKKTLAGLALGSGLAMLTGCYCYRQWVDPCWPERYNSVARQTVRDTFNTQAMNGHILDQTIWAYHFDVDAKNQPTDKLNGAGMAHLTYLARRRPVPDSHVFLQTSRDLKLDEARITAIQNYLAHVMIGRNASAEFVVTVHDPADVGIQSNPISGNQRNPTFKGSIPQLYNNFRGMMFEKEGTLNVGGSSGGS